MKTKDEARIDLTVMQMFSQDWKNPTHLSCSIFEKHCNPCSDVKLIQFVYEKDYEIYYLKEQSKMEFTPKLKEEIIDKHLSPLKEAVEIIKQDLIR